MRWAASSFIWRRTNATSTSCLLSFIGIWASTTSSTQRDEAAPAGVPRAQAAPRHWRSPQALRAGYMEGGRRLSEMALVLRTSGSHDHLVDTPVLVPRRVVRLEPRVVGPRGGGGAD